ncbi:MAG TPA: hypothetical protein VGC91_13820 [Pyrinomonadaceae bacterium]|jgi:hypothetical protein
MAVMSELSEEHWAVISGRGVEASGLSYDAAVILMRELDGEKIYGLCIVTDEAAGRDAKTATSGSRLKVQGSRLKTKDRVSEP